VGHSYKQLVVWQKSVDLVEQVYRVTATFPKEEIYGLTSQIRRAAVSVPSNIAEGQGRLSKGEFKHFLGMSRGSLLELETQLKIAERLGYVTSELTSEADKLLTEVLRVLNGLIASVERS
jgi:four helix bundle protein